MRLRLLLLALVMGAPSTVTAHARSVAELTIAEENGEVLELSMEMSQEDVEELLDPVGLLAVARRETQDEAPRLHLERAIPRWFELQADGNPCPLLLTDVTRVGVNGVRLAAEANCSDAGELALIWSASELGILDLRAEVRFLSQSGIQTAHVDRASPRAVFRMSRNYDFPRWPIPLGLLLLGGGGVAMWRRKLAEQ